MQSSNPARTFFIIFILVVVVAVIFPTLRGSIVAIDFTSYDKLFQAVMAIFPFMIIPIVWWGYTHRN